VFDSADSFAEGFAVAWEHGQCGFIDKRGDWVIKPTFQSCRAFSEGLAAVSVKVQVGNRINYFWGFIDQTGQFVIQPILRNATPFVCGLAMVFNDDKGVYINKRGNEINIIASDAGT
jgi:hypothetical protein